jgi:DNA-binding MarR family transcriptional regulator
MSGNDPNRSLGFLLHEVTRLLRRNFSRRMAHFGLTQAQWQTLAHLSRCQGVNQTTLADILDVQPITLARLIDRLEGAGWVQRRPDPADRRAFRLYLTEKAKPLIDEMWEGAAETREEAMAGLAPTARDAMIDSLLAIKRNLAAAEQRAAGADGAMETEDA